MPKKRNSKIVILKHGKQEATMRNVRATKKRENNIDRKWLDRIGAIEVRINDLQSTVNYHSRSIARLERTLAAVRFIIETNLAKE